MVLEIYEVVVVGGGIMGSATAYYLSKLYGNKVLLLEQFDFLHRKGSSHGDSRIIRMTYPQDFYTELMIDSYKLWDEAEKEANTKVFTKTGGLDISREHNEDFKGIIRAAKRFNIPHKILNPEEVKEMFPTIQLPKGHAAVYSPDAGILNATKSVAVFQSLARKHACVLLDNIVISDISSVEQDPNQNLIQVTSTTGKIYLAKKCVVTAGAWTRKLFAQSQIQIPNIELPLQSIQTTVAYWVVDNPDAYSSARFPVYIYHDDNNSFIYGFPAHEFPNMIKCAAHHGPPCDPDNRDFLPGTLAIENEVSPFLQKMFIGVNPVPITTESCMYTMTPDENFIIDHLPKNPNVLIGCGFSGHGFKLAPIVGKILSELIHSGKHPFPNARQHFSLERLKLS